jgi:hypothetical protein
MGWPRFTVSIVATLVGMLAQGEARADKFDDTLDLSLHARGTWFEADQLELVPAPGYRFAAIEAANPRLDGVGKSFALGVRGNLSLDGFRFGLGVGVSAVQGMAFEADDGALVPGRLWGAPAEAFIGYAFGDVREVRPYLEARGTLTILQLTLDDGEISVPFNAYAPGVATRGGVLVWINEYFFFDLGVNVGIVGPERFAIDTGLGLPIPLSNL